MLTISLHLLRQLPHRPTHDSRPQPRRPHLQQNRPHHHQLTHNPDQLRDNLSPPRPETPLHQVRDPPSTNPLRNRRNHRSIHRQAERRLPATRLTPNRLQRRSQPRRRRHVHALRKPKRSHVSTHATSPSLPLTSLTQPPDHLWRPPAIAEAGGHTQVDSGTPPWAMDSPAQPARLLRRPTGPATRPAHNPSKSTTSPSPIRKQHECNSVE